MWEQISTYVIQVSPNIILDKWLFLRMLQLKIALHDDFNVLPLLFVAIEYDEEVWMTLLCYGGRFSQRWVNIQDEDLVCYFG